MKDKEKQITIKHGAGAMADLLNQEIEELQKAKAIEEMAKVNHEKCGFCDTCDNCKYQWHEDCEKIKYATNIYNAGYRKIPEDSVVLSKEDMKKYAKDCIAGQETGLDIINALIARAERYKEQAKQTSKETAEKILKDITLFLDDKTLAIITRYFKEILGVEIKE